MNVKMNKKIRKRKSKIILGMMIKYDDKNVFLNIGGTFVVIFVGV